MMLPSLPSLPSLRIAREALSATMSTLSGETASGNGLAWQREMERAQMQGWLEHDALDQGWHAPQVAEQAATLAGNAVPVSRSVSVLAAGLELSSQGLAASVRNDLPYGTATPYGMPAAGMDKDSMSGLGASIEQRFTLRLSQIEADRTSLANAPHDATSSGSAGAGKTMALPRITLERIGAGVRLWLGVGMNDGLSHEALMQLLQSVTEVLSDAGLSLESVMLNGEPLQAAGLPSEATQAAKAAKTDFQTFIESQGEM